MPIQVLSNAGLWLDDIDLANVASNMVSVDYGAELQDKTLLGDTSRKRVAGLKTIIFATEGYYEEASLDPTLFGNIGLNDVPVTIAIAPTAGSQAFLFQMTQGEYALLGEIGAVNPFSASGEATEGPLVKGSLLHNATETATGNGAGVNEGAVAAAETVYGALHVFGIGGTPTLDVVIESDADNTFTTATTRLTFPQFTAKGSNWQSLGPGAIADTWWRARFTIGGGSPSVAFAVSFGII